MRPSSRFPLRVALIAVLAALAALASSAVAQADPPGTCTMGTPYTTGLTLSVDGAAQAQTADGVYGTYTLSLCRVAGSGPGSTSTYNFSVGAFSGGQQMDLSTADSDRTFTITFTPQAGDTPLTAEGKARISSFSVDPFNANAVVLSAKPIAFADIWNCPEMPLQCVIDHPVASVEHPANLTGGIRYSDPTGSGAAGFTDLPGLTTSSGAYVFFVWASCPTNPMRDQSYSGLKIDLGGPHFLPDGATPNIGSVSAYIPAAAVASCFGASPQAYAASAAITRTENGTTDPASPTAGADSGLRYVLTADDAGVTISIPDVTFSQPTYRFGTRSGRSLAKLTKRTAALAKALGVKAPKGGALRAVVAKSSRRVCAASATSVYAFAKGTCRYTVTALDAKGKAQGSGKGEFVLAKG